MCDSSHKRTSLINESCGWETIRSKMYKCIKGQFMPTTVTVQFKLWFYVEGEIHLEFLMKPNMKLSHIEAINHMFHLYDTVPVKST